MFICCFSSSAGSSQKAEERPALPRCTFTRTTERRHRRTSQTAQLTTCVKRFARRADPDHEERRRPDGLVPQPVPRGPNAVEAEERCSRRAGNRLTVALLHLPPPPSRARPGAAVPYGASAPLPPPPKPSLAPLASQRPDPAPSCPLAPHLTWPYTRPGMTTGPRRPPPRASQPVRPALLTLRAVGRPPEERGRPCRWD